MDEAFLKRLIETFKVEAEEILNTISAGLIELEKKITTEERKILIQNIFMSIHSLKGAARSVNFVEIESICQFIEDIFVKIKNNPVGISRKLFDLLHYSMDLITKLINSSPEERILIDIDEIIDNISEKSVNEFSEITETELIEINNGEKPEKVKEAFFFEKKDDSLIIPILENTDKNFKETIGTKGKISIPLPQRANPQIKKKEKSISTETVRISASKLDSLLLQSEEMLSSKLIIKEKADELRDLVNVFGKWKKEYYRVIPDIQELKFQYNKKQKNEVNLNQQKLEGIIDFIYWNHEQIKMIESQLNSFVNQFDFHKRQIGGMVDNLLEDVKKVLMLPFSTIMEIFPKMVRQISVDQGKQIELLIEGSDIEIDKRILEEIKDPITHIIRNSIDHGLEKPEERLKNSKSHNSIINIIISTHDNNKIEITITDDGRGIDYLKVKKAAIKDGFISEDEINKFPENEIISLIFHPGFSTNAMVTDLSGRGLGLAIVKEKIEKLGGSVSLTTELGNYTSFKIILPTRITTFKGILVNVGQNYFVIPESNIVRVLKIKKENIQTFDNKETIFYKDKNIAFVFLADILEIVEKKREKVNDLIPVLILSNLEKTIAIAVDAILDEHEILVKQFNRQLTRVRNISGATILGSGKVVPILNIQDLIKSAIKNNPFQKRINSKEETEDAIKYILVAEDSITSRMLIKNILEAGGYKVKTVIDGEEAFNAMKSENFDLLVSDIEMPKMNGFELITRIRSNKQTENIPAILITSLASEEDREKGLDAGANAYIVKSSFDQSNLLSIIKKII